MIVVIIDVVKKILSQHRASNLSITNQDAEISEDSLWNATSESQRSSNSRNKKRKRLKNMRGSYSKDVEITEDSLWNATSESVHSSNSQNEKRERLKNISGSYSKDLSTELDETRSDQDSAIQVTTKKTARKPPEHAERDKDMLNVIQLQAVISELGMDQDEGKITKRDLSRRFQLIQQQKAATETEDFESLLKEIKAGSTEESSGFRWDSVRPQTPYIEGDDTFTMDVNTTSGERLGLFNNEDFPKEQDLMSSDHKTWSALDWYKHYRAENDEKVSFNPGKYYAWDPYEELIRWTEEGKMWKFPIDNEAGMEEEAKTPFYEHVFLEDKLNEGEWCPKTGPIRNFMSSVIIALSQNPFLTVKEKHEHIDWFREYFMERLQTIKKLGLVDDLRT